MLMTIQPQVEIVSSHARIPEYETSNSAALDFRAAIEKEMILMPGETKLIPTGLKIWIENGHVCAMLLPRSGLGHKHGIVLGNGTGLIDADYQGEWMISAHNRSETAYRIQPGERIAQAVLVPVIKISEFNIVDKITDETERGEGGFGSTGKE